MATTGASASPATPLTCTFSPVLGRASRRDSDWSIIETAAPVSRMKLYGPRPLIRIGTSTVVAPHPFLITLIGTETSPERSAWDLLSASAGGWQLVAPMVTSAVSAAAAA